MYSKEEKKQLKQDFWDGFQKYSGPKRKQLGLPKKWMLQQTGIKALDLKFDIDHEKASVGIDVVSKSIEVRVDYWNKLLGLKNILEKEYELDLVWDDMMELDSGKYIVRIAVYKDKVNVLDKTKWEAVYGFFYENMSKLEIWLEEYRDILKHANL